MRTMTHLRRTTLEILIAALFLVGSLGGCAGAPLQQLSDARQAVRAAEKAGAAEYAPDLLDEAKRLVESSRVNLHKGDYRQSRDDADLAREKAMEARRTAESAHAAPQGS
jgi:hypothetical protein